MQRARFSLGAGDVLVGKVRAVIGNEEAEE